MTKAIYIDGPSFFHIGRVLGIGQFNFQALYRILVEKIGECREIFNGKPIYVLPSRKAQEMRKPLENVGFEVVACDPTESKDDKFIIREIKRLSVENISEVVLVSADGDYFACLEEKKGAGVKVYLVATAQNDPRRDTPMLSDITKGAFNFIELGDFKNEIMKRPWIDNPMADKTDVVTQQKEMRNNGAATLAKVNLKLVGCGATIGQLLSEVAVLTGRYRGIEVSCSITSFPSVVVPATEE